MRKGVHEGAAGSHSLSMRKECQLRPRQGGAELKASTLGPQDIAVLRRLIGNSQNWRARFDLLMFLGRYHHGWYSRRALHPRTACSRLEIQTAMDEFVDCGALGVRRDGAVPYYRFTTDAAVRDAAQAIGRLTPGERRRVLHDLLQPAADGSSQAQTASGRPWEDAPEKGGHRIGKSVQ